jgi:hypothetical protein
VRCAGIKEYSCCYQVCPAVSFNRLGFRVLSLPFVFRIHSGKHPALQPGRFMLGNLPGFVWLSDNSDAFTDIIFGTSRIIVNVKEETI